MRKVLQDHDIPAVVSQLGFESGKTAFALAEEAGLSINTVYNWCKSITTPRLREFLWFLDAAGYRLVLEKKEA